MLLATGAALLAAALPAAAFHSGGVGACGGCHVLHPGSNPGDPLAYTSLLTFPNPTDLCLSCHATQYGNTWGATRLAPGPVYGGGSFIALTEPNLNDRPGSATAPAPVIPGHRAGHTVLSSDRGIVPDPDHLTAPGGSYPTDKMHCTSCHDPHGKSGAFRMLWTAGQTAVVDGYSFTYVNAAPVATGIDVTGPGESSSNHTAYASGMSRWCMNCHSVREGATGFHNAFTKERGHPVDEGVEGEMVTMYNRYGGYDGTTIFPTTFDQAYEPLLAFEDPAQTTTSTQGMTTSSQISCITCHRAHASSSPHAGRWDFRIDRWGQEGVQSGSYPIPNPYLATAGANQVGLCSKCHPGEAWNAYGR